MKRRLAPRTLVLLLLVVVFAAAALSASSGALAVTPNDVQYNTPSAALTPPPRPVGVKGSRTVTAPTPLTSPSGTLPFTGLQLGVVSVGGALLIAGGFALRRLGRKSSQSKS